MKRMKKTLCILLSLLMVLAMIPGTALANTTGNSAAEYRLAFSNLSDLPETQQNLEDIRNQISSAIDRKDLSNFSIEKYIYIAGYAANGELVSLEPAEDNVSFNVVYEKMNASGYMDVTAAQDLTVEKVNGTTHKYTISYTKNADEFDLDIEWEKAYLIEGMRNEERIRPATIRMPFGLTLQADNYNYIAYPDLHETLRRGFFYETMSVVFNGNPVTDYTISSDESFGTVKKNTADGTFTFSPVKAGTCPISITYNEKTYGFQFLIRENDLGGGNESQQTGPVRFFDSDHREITGNVVYDKALQDGTFFVVLTQDKNNAPENVRLEMVDKYNAMANGGFRYENGIVPDTVIKFQKQEQNEELYNALNLKDATKAYYVYKATKADTLQDYSYLDTGILSGWIYFYNANGGNLIEKSNQFTVCDETLTASFNSGKRDLDKIHFYDNPSENAVNNASNEVEIKMFESCTSQANAVYLICEKGLGTPEFHAYTRYQSGIQGGDRYVYKELNDALTATKLTTSLSGENSAEYDCYQVNLKQFFGHDDIVLTANSVKGTETYQASVVLKKTMQFKYKTSGMAEAEDIYDYTNKMAMTSLGTGEGMWVLEKAVSSDGWTTRLHRKKGNTRSGNRPYSGGYYGMVMDVEDDNELIAVKGQGYNAQGNPVDTYLSYVLDMNFYFEVSDPDGNLDEEKVEELYQSGQDMQCSAINNGKAIIETTAVLGQYLYNPETQKYDADILNFHMGVVRALATLKTWARSNGYQLNYIDTCMYYDIFVPDGEYITGEAGGDISRFYDAIDQIGTVEFVTQKVNAEELFFHSEVGIKPSDEGSDAGWGDYHFDDFNSQRMTSAERDSHESDMQGFYENIEENVVRGYHFEMNHTFNGLVDVFMPVPDGVDPQECQIYWMYDMNDDEEQNSGNLCVSVPIETRHARINAKDYLVFTTNHFSDYVIAADENAISEDFVEDVDIPNNSGSITYVPPMQKPVVKADDGAKVTASSDGSKVTIAVEAGYEIVDVIVNGVSKGAVKELTGLKTGDKVEVITKKAEEELTPEEIKSMMEKIDADNFSAHSRLVTLKSGKQAIKITWTAPEGIDFDGVEIFRSTKRSSGYTKKPIFTTTKDVYYNTAIKEGTRYYYKVRGFVTIDGEKVYTQYSTKAWRTVK